MSPSAHGIRPPTRLDFALMIMTSLILASGFIAIRVAVAETGPVWLATIRVGIGFMVLLPYVLWRGVIWPSGAAEWLLVTGMALLNVVVPFMLVAWAGQTIEAGVLSLLMGTGPFLALIGSHLMTDDDRMTPRKVVSVLFGFSGILVLVGPSILTGLAGGPLLAKLAALAASACYVMAGLLIRRIAMAPGRLAGLALGIGTVCLVPLALTVEGLPPQSLSMPALGALVYLGLFPTGIAYIMRFALIRAIGYSRFSLSINLVPVFGVALGVVLLGEQVSLNLIAALALVLAGLVVGSGGRKIQPASL